MRNLIIVPINGNCLSNLYPVFRVNGRPPIDRFTVKKFSHPTVWLANQPHVDAPATQDLDKCTPKRPNFGGSRLSCLYSQPHNVFLSAALSWALATLIRNGSYRVCHHWTFTRINWQSPPLLASLFHPGVSHHRLSTLPILSLYPLIEMPALTQEKTLAQDLKIKKTKSRNGCGRCKLKRVNTPHSQHDEHG